MSSVSLGQQQQYQNNRSNSNNGSAFSSSSIYFRKSKINNWNRDLIFLLSVCLVCVLQCYRTSREVELILWPSSSSSATKTIKTTTTRSSNGSGNNGVSSQLKFGFDGSDSHFGIARSLMQEDFYNNEYKNSNNNIKNGNNNNNNKEEDNNQKQIAIIHVGPHKTGSTALQSSVFRTLKYKQILQEQDNFALFPFDQGSGKCFFPATPPKGQKQKNQCWVDDSKLQLMKDVVQSATANHQHLMYSAEALEFTDEYNLTTLRDHFLPQDTFEMRISVVYRRFYQWIISTHGQRYRKGTANWDEWPKNKQTKQHRVKPFATWLSESVIQDSIQNRYTVNTYKTYQEYFPNTTYLINYHDNVVLKNDAITTAVANAYTKASAAAATSGDPNSNDSSSLKALSPSSSSLSTAESWIPNDFVTNFACHPKTHTPHFCATKQQEAYENALFAIQSALLPSTVETDAPTSAPTTSNDKDEYNGSHTPFRSNKGEATIYDEILMAAYSKGMLPENITEVVYRYDARWMVQEFIETNNFFQINDGTAVSPREQQDIAGSSSSTNEAAGAAAEAAAAAAASRTLLLQDELKLQELPLKCIDDTLADSLLETSLKVEQELFPDFFASPQGETAIRDEFESFRHSIKLCSVDTEKLFERYPFFATFFSYEEFIKVAKKGGYYIPDHPSPPTEPQSQ